MTEIFFLVENVFVLIPLVTGFIFNAASAFTAAFSRRWGERWGSWISFILRNILGIPMWAAGLALAVRTRSSNWFTPGSAIIILGWVLILAGCGIILWGLKVIRWRAVKPSVRDELAQNGIYAYIRHPLHTGTFLEIAGLWGLIPTRAVTLTCVLWWVWVCLQTRLEEIDLVQRLPGYREYMQRVPRFLPSFWKKS